MTQTIKTKRSEDVISSRVVLISPQWAMQLLEGNKSNRTLDQAWVDTLGRTMAAGGWKLNGEPIKVTKTGRLVDGQHRLWACVESNAPFYTLLVEGLEEDTYASLGMQKGRTNRDIFAQNGITQGSVKSSICGALWFWEQGKLSMWHNSKLVPSKDELLDVYKRNSAEVDRATETVPWWRALLEPRISGFCWIVFGRKDSAYRDLFFERLSGINLSADMASYWLRKRLEQNMGAVTKLRPRHKLMLTIKAWNYRDAPLKVLRMAPNEDFPEIR